MFTEEVEDDDVKVEQIKKEVTHVSIDSPVTKKEESDFSESNFEFKVEEKSNKPVFFDDNDFRDLNLGVKEKEEKPKIVEKELYNNKAFSEKKVEEKKVFKPTPIISPVYGVLDKNYHKEDIKTKNNSFNSTYYNHKDVRIDDIRKKAYGTLEDELEITLFGKKDDYAEESSLDIDMFDELMESSEEKLGNTEKIDSSDLFNMIDSMYENEDDNNGIC